MLSSDQVSESGPKVCQGRMADSLGPRKPQNDTNHDLATRWSGDPESAPKRVPILHHSLLEHQVQNALMEDKPPILHHSQQEHKSWTLSWRISPRPPAPRTQQSQRICCDADFQRLSLPPPPAPQNTTIITHLNHNAFVVIHPPLPSPLSNIGLLELRIF